MTADPGLLKEITNLNTVPVIETCRIDHCFAGVLDFEDTDPMFSCGNDEPVMVSFDNGSRRL